MSDKGKSAKEEKGADIPYFHPDLLEIPSDGSSPYLKGSRCKKCGQLDFPKLSPCPSCWGEEFEVVPLSRRGRLYASSDNYIGATGLKTPYTFGYIDLPENLRIFAQLEGDAGSFVCDQDVEMIVGQIGTKADGQPLMSYKFKKISP